MTETLKGDIMVTFPSQKRYVHMITTVASNAAVIAGFDKAVAGKVAIATDEAVTNVIKHAYHEDPDKQITFKVEINPESLVIKILHTGEALNKNAIKLPVMENYIKNRQKGGLGLYIINQFMDEVDYQIGKQHCCQMTKYRNNTAKLEKDGGK